MHKVPLNCLFTLRWFVSCHVNFSSRTKKKKKDFFSCVAVSWGWFLVGGVFKISNGEALCYDLIFLAEDGMCPCSLGSQFSIGRSACRAGARWSHPAVMKCLHALALPACWTLRYTCPPPTTSSQSPHRILLRAIVSPFSR